jgi:hypothetical protein
VDFISTSLVEPEPNAPAPAKCRGSSKQLSY